MTTVQGTLQVYDWLSAGLSSSEKEGCFPEVSLGDSKLAECSRRAASSGRRRDERENRTI